MSKFKKIIMAVIIAIGLTSTAAYAYNSLTPDTTSVSTKKEDSSNSTLLNATDTDNSTKASGGCDHNCAACLNRCH